MYAFRCVSKVTSEPGFRFPYASFSFMYRNWCQLFFLEEIKLSISSRSSHTTSYLTSYCIHAHDVTVVGIDASVAGPERLLFLLLEYDVLKINSL